MGENGFSQIPLIRRAKLIGMLFENSMMEYMIAGRHHKGRVRCGDYDMMPGKVPSVTLIRIPPSGLRRSCSMVRAMPLWLA